MSIQFFYSDDIISLKNSFIKELMTVKSADPFSCPFIVVPNINVKKWIQLEIARKNGISANLDLHYLEEGLVNLLGQSGQKENMRNHVFLGDKDRQLDLQLMILSVIMQNYNNIELEPLKQYLEIKSTINNETSANKRLWQIAEKLSFYFREYEYQRSDMIGAWEKDESFFENIPELESSLLKNRILRIETFERFIYQAVFCDKKAKSLASQFSTDDRIYTTLPRYASSINLPNKHTNETIYIFGLSQISPFHFELINKLSALYNFKIFQLNYLNKIDDSFSWTNKPIEAEDIRNPLIARWGIPSIENMKVLSTKLAKTNALISTEYSQPYSGGVLHHLKNSLLKNIHPVEKLIQDKTLQIAGAPSARREIEVIYHSILRQMKEDPTLLFTDIAILVPDMDIYRVHVTSVFSEIPFNLSDTSAGTESVFSDALINGLEIASGRFSRPEIIKFILNPCVLFSLGINRDTAEKWIEIIDKLNIFHSYNINDKKDVAISETLQFTWEEGLQRLRLGKIMGNSDDEKAGQYIPYQDMDTQDADFLDSFITSFEKLFDFYKDIRNKNLSGKEWKEKTGYFINTFLNVPDELKEENSVRESAIALLENFDKFDILLNNQNIDIYYIVSYIKNNIQDIKAQRGKYLSDGVTISKLMPMKPIPFKIMYVAGLGEGIFPGRNDRSTLDLRNLYRIEGDIEKSQNDLYLFLEIILSAQDKLYLTYVSKNLEKDETLYYSPALRELISYINKFIVSEKMEIIDLPLNAESTKNFIDSNIDSTITDLFCCYTNDKRTIRYLYDINSFSDELQQKIIENADLTKQKIITEMTDFQKSEINIRVLFEYIIDQPASILKHKCGIYSFKEENRSIIADEPFFEDNYYSNNFSENAILSYLIEIINNSKTDSDSMNNAINQAIKEVKLERKKGNIAEGVYGDFSETKIIAAVANKLEKVTPETLEFLKESKYIETIIIGEGKPSLLCLYSAYKTGNQNITAVIKNIFVGSDFICYPIIVDSILEKDKLKFYALNKCIEYNFKHSLFSLVSKQEYKFIILFIMPDNSIILDMTANLFDQKYIDSLVAEYCSETECMNIRLQYLLNKPDFLLLDKKELNEKYLIMLEELEDLTDFSYKEKSPNKLSLLTKAIVPDNLHDILNVRYKPILTFLQELETGVKNAKS